MDTNPYSVFADKIEHGEYYTKFPFPPYREPSLRHRHLAKDRKMRRLHEEDQQRLEAIFKADLKTYAENKIGIQISGLQFDVLFRLAWEKGHSSGYREVLNEADEILSVVGMFIGVETK